LENLRSSAKKAFIWELFGKFGKTGMGFVFSIFLARLLEPEDFGLIAMVMVVVAIAETFTDFGLGGALIQRRRLHDVHISSVFYFNIFIGAVLSLITFLSASYIADFYNNTALVLLTQVISFTFIIGSFGSIQTVLLRKELNYTLLTKLTFISSMISGIVGISLAFYGAGVWSLVVQTLSSGVLYVILVWSTSKWRPTYTFSFKALIQLWKFGFHLFLVVLMNVVFSRLDFVMIGKLFPVATLGFFQRGKSLNEMVKKFSSDILMSVMFPVLSKIQNDLPRMQNLIISFLNVIVFATFLIMGALYLVSEELIVLLFSDKWLPSVAYFHILVLGGVFEPINALLINVLLSRGKSKNFLYMQIFITTIDVINIYYGIMAGIEIYLYGLVIVSFITVNTVILFVTHELDLTFGTLFKPIIVQIVISALAIAGTTFLVQAAIMENILSLIIKLLIFTSLYFVINIILKTNSYNHFVEQVVLLARREKSN
jgi:O-antigen/teichoic acid export membrane protein